MARSQSTEPTGVLPALADLDEEQRYHAFTALQELMPAVWESMRADVPEESVVVVPSVSLERSTATSGAAVQAMEERALFFLLLLRQPRLRMVYVTSMPVPEAVVEYYLGLLPGVIPSHARARLTLVPVGDASVAPLSAKLLARPRLLDRIRALVPDPRFSHLIPYNTTALERDVALSLGIPMYGADPRLAAHGTKSGARSLFEEVGVRCPAGAEGLRDADELVAALARIRVRRPSVREVIVKLNDGVSGAGNALLSLADLPAAGTPAEAAALQERLSRLEPEAATWTAADFLEAFADGGGVVEERIVGAELRSPSVQLRVLPTREVELLSTHDQLLGGPTGQQYVGAVFPADPDYAPLITQPALAVGRRLAELGVLGRFAVDFVVVRDAAGRWSAYAIEVNLRKGGTTHPFLTLQFLTDGRYDAAACRYLTAGGATKHLVATDHFEDDRLRVLTVEDLLDVVARHRLHFDHARQTGVVLHMLSAVTECGRVGLTAVGDTADDAWSVYEQAQRVLLEEAEASRGRGPTVAVPAGPHAEVAPATTGGT